MQKIIVTGGLGFIGSNFIRLLLHENLCAEILNIDKQTYAGNPENLAEFENDRRYIFLKADIGNVEKIENAINEFKPTSIVNFAAESHVDRSIDSPEPFIQTNVLGTLRLLESTKNFFNSLDEKSKNEFRFLHISTDEVYGSLSNEDPAFSESTGYSPNSPYSASKAGADHLVRAYFHTFGLPVLTTNCSNNYGPYQFPEKLIPLMILNALEGKNFPFMEMVRILEIGYMLKITAEAFSQFFKEVGLVKHTVLVVILKKLIWKWWILFVRLWIIIVMKMPPMRT